MKKCLLSLTALPLFLAVSAAALDFEPIALSGMIRSADLAVAGRVTDATAKTVTLDISDQYFGPATEGTVTIQRNKDWSGAEGLGIFRIGQELVIFAIGSRDGAGEGPRWRTLGIENEAVLPVDDGEVFFSGQMPGLEMETHDLDGLTISAHVLELSEFNKAVRGYRDCVGPVGPAAASEDAQITCTDSQFEALRSETDLGRRLTDPLAQE